MATFSIQVHLDDGEVTTFRFPPGNYVLGRDPSCSVLVNSPGVSRRHASVTLRDEILEIEDLGSSGGTFVDGEQINERVSVGLPAQIFLGHLAVSFFLGEPPEASSELEVESELGSGAAQSEESVDIALSMSGAVKRPVAVGAVNGQMKKRLEMLYDLPLVFAAETNLESLYELILERVIRLTSGAVRGALLIRDMHDGKLSVRASVPKDAPPISRTLIRRAALEQMGFIWGEKDMEGMDISASMAAIRIRTGMYAPLVWKGETLGVLFLDNPHRSSAFTGEDLQFLLSVAHYAAAAVSNQMLQTEIIQNNRTLQNLLANFSPKIRDCLLEKSREGKLQPGGVKSQVTILLSDLRGFTRTSAGLSTHEIVDMLNDYLWALGEEIFRHDGTIDKFIGDAILAVFGSPEPDEEHAWKAVCAAIQMQHRMAAVNERRRANGQPVCEMGVGVHTGEVLHGFIGAEERLEYTVIGDTVNKTSRYCSGAGESEILLGPETNRTISDKLVTSERMIKTKHEGEIPAYNVDWRNITLS